MSYRVVKFGGSNLKDVQGIKKVIKAIQNYNQPLVIVVSAFYGMTNRLIEAIENAKLNKLDIDELVTDIYNNKLENVTQSVSDEDLINKFKDELNKRLKELKEFFLGISYIKDIPPFLYDEILSYGERFSSLSLHYILKDIGIDCREVFPEDIGLITDGEFVNATVNFKLSSEALNKSLSSNLTYIIPGFYGVSEKGKTTLLGRGGTDYSAAAIASCLNADSLDLWKDVEGFLSADPKIVDTPVNIESLTYAEAAELAYFGSKILHPRTPEPLAKKKIPIRIFNIDNSYDGIRPLTIINGKERITNDVIKSVSYSDDFGIIKLKGSGVGIKPGILAKSTVELDNANINIKSVITSQTAINILLSSKDLKKAKNVIEQKDIHGINEVEIHGDISIIAAVGEGLTTQSGVAARIFGAVARKGINVRIISFGASLVAVYFIVDRKDRSETIYEIHKEFFVNEDTCKCVQ